MPIRAGYGHALILNLGMGLVPIRGLLIGVAGVLLARINRFGAFASQVDLAVDILSRHRDATTCFRWAGVRPERDRYRLARLPIAIRLALEMAAHEETERRILEGELAYYERQWRKAEPVARIADGLLEPALPWDSIAFPQAATVARGRLSSSWR